MKFPKQFNEMVAVAFSSSKLVNRVGFIKINKAVFKIEKIYKYINIIIYNFCTFNKSRFVLFTQNFCEPLRKTRGLPGVREPQVGKH